MRGTSTKDQPKKPPKLGIKERMSAAGASKDHALLAKQSTELKRMWSAFDYKTLDVFGYYPNYTFPGYRSSVGAFSSIFLFLGIFLRLITTASDFIYSMPVITEDRRIFASDGFVPFAVPKVGVVFKQTGWKPFYDPTYFSFRFRQAPWPSSCQLPASSLPAPCQLPATSYPLPAGLRRYGLQLELRGPRGHAVLLRRHLRPHRRGRGALPCRALDHAGQLLRPPLRLLAHRGESLPSNPYPNPNPNPNPNTDTDTDTDTDTTTTPTLNTKP